MLLTDKAKIIVDLLNKNYKNETKCFLNYNNAWQLLIATILSAQCTDDRVNIVTKDLFNKYTSIESFANADIAELETDIYSTGFYHNKAKHIKQSMQILIKEFDSIMPSSIETLVKLPGVGRKTANVIRTHIFNIPSIVVDTHVKRISLKLALTNCTNPDKIEFDLMKILPVESWSRYNTQMITHGRNVCIARRPKCDKCCFAELCIDFN